MIDGSMFSDDQCGLYSLNTGSHAKAGVFKTDFLEFAGVFNSESLP